MTTRLRAIPTATKALVALLFAALMAVGLQPPAAFASGFDVSLNVSTKSGAPIPALTIFAYPVENHAIVGDAIGATIGASAGKYAILGVTSGQQYALFFQGPASGATTFDQYYGGTTDVEDAKYLSWNADSTLDITLATNSLFTGKVTGTGNKALPGVEVLPWRFDGNDWFPLDDTSAVTGVTGMYSIRNLEPGSYRLQFLPENVTGYLGEFSGNVTVFGNAAAYNIGVGATVVSNAMLAVGGKIGGTVQLFDQAGIQSPADGIYARAYPVDSGGAIDTAPLFISALTGTNGAWTVPGLPPGDYKVKLYDFYGTFVDKWAGPGGGGNTVGDANTATFHVTAGHTTPVPGVTRLDWFAADFPTSLNLTVDDANGDPLDGVVYIEPASGEDFYRYDAIVGGNLSILYMPVGTYNIYIVPFDSISQPYVGQITIVSVSGGNHPHIDLDPVSAFTYDVPATIAETDPSVGTHYVVDPGHTSLDDGAGPEAPVQYSYIWLRDDAPIYGQFADTVSSYTSLGADSGKKISVIVRADAFGFDPVFTPVVAANLATPGAAPAIISSPVISGPTLPVPGSVLKVSTGTWNTPGVKYTFQWFYHGDPIPGASAQSLTINGDTSDDTITAEVTASKPGYTTSSPASSSNFISTGHLPSLKQTKGSVFTVHNELDGSITMTATPGTWSPAATGWGVSWYADGNYLFSIGLGTPYNCLAADCAGKAITAIVQAFRSGYGAGAKEYVVRKGSVPPVLGSGDEGTVTDVTTGNPVVLGSVAAIGHVLRVTNPVYTYPSPSTETFAYQWQRQTGASWANISMATKVSYVPTASDLNHNLRVRVIVTPALYPTALSYVDAGIARYRQDLVAGASPTFSIAGTTAVGTIKKEVMTGVWPVVGTTQSFQWYRCVSTCSDTSSANSHWVVITGAKSSSYVPPAGMAGQELLLQVTGSKSGYQSSTRRTPSLGALTADAGDIWFFTNPSYASGLVSGKAVVGRTLKVTPVTIDRTVTRTITWYDCSVSNCGARTLIPGANATSFTPDASLLLDGNPHWIQFEEHLTPPGFGTTHIVGPPVELTVGTWAPITAPKVPAGLPGSTYQVLPGTWPGAIVPTFEYQWYEGPDMVGGATSSSYVSAEAVDPVWVLVTAKRQGYTDLTFRLVAHKGLLPAPALALSGSTLGNTLQLATPLSIPVNNPAASIAYQWFSSTTMITGATSATFTPSATYVGKVLRLRITITSAFYTVPAMFTPTVTLLPHAAPVGVPVIVSTPNTFEPGAKLTANVSSFGPGFTYMYRWERSPDGIAPYVPFSTASSYVLKTSDKDTAIRLVVKTVRAGYLSATVTTGGILINGFGPAVLTAPFQLGGSARIDTPLTAAPTLSTTGMTLAYSWTRNGVLVPGATSASLTPTASWIGDEIQAHVTATKVGWYPATFDSNVVTVIDGAAPTAAASSFTVTPAHPHSTGAITVGPGVWNVGGLTLTYSWYSASDTGHVTVLNSGPTWPSAGPGGTYSVVVTATRPGYLPGSATVTVVVTP